MCHLDLKSSPARKSPSCLTEPPVPLITIFSSFSANFLVFPIFLGLCDSVLLQITAVLRHHKVCVISQHLVSIYSKSASGENILIHISRQ